MQLLLLEVAIGSSAAFLKKANILLGLDGYRRLLSFDDAPMYSTFSSQLFYTLQNTHALCYATLLHATLPAYGSHHVLTCCNELQGVTWRYMVIWYFAVSSWNQMLSW
jgi:hypothetical protein